MDIYRRSDRESSRIWRRNRDYTFSQIRHAARRQAAQLERRGSHVTVTRGGRVLAVFTRVSDQSDTGARGHVSETLRALASLLR